MTLSLAGGCRCGAVRYAMTGMPIVVNCCHCRDCQRLSGSAFAINAMIETGRVISTGTTTPAVQVDAQGNRSWRCEACGVLLYADLAKLGDGLRFVRVGTLDEGERMVPDAHFFVRSKHPWVVVPDGVPVFETLPDSGMGVALDDGRRARLAAAIDAYRPEPIRD